MPLTIIGTFSPRLSASTADQSIFAAIAERGVPLAAGAAPALMQIAEQRALTASWICLRAAGSPREHLIPERRTGLGRNFLQRDTRTAADHHDGPGCRCAFDRRQLAVRMKPLLIRDRSEDDRRKVLLAKQCDAEIQAACIDQHPWPQRDSIGATPVAAGNQRKHGRCQHQLRLLLVFQRVDELSARRYHGSFHGWLHARR
jgi:hypothetical protein